MNKEEKEKDLKYPYGYASDFIAWITPWYEVGFCIESEERRCIIDVISIALGMDIKEFNEKLADMYLKYDFQIRSLKNNTEKFEFPENAIACKIITDDNMKRAFWLEPRSDCGEIITEIKCCGECDFISKPAQKGMSIWCDHPEAKGVKIENEFYEIHPKCPIETVKQVTVRHADGKYMWNVKKYLS